MLAPLSGIGAAADVTSTGPESEDVDDDDEDVAAGAAGDGGVDSAVLLLLLPATATAATGTDGDAPSAAAVADAVATPSVPLPLLLPDEHEPMSGPAAADGALGTEPPPGFAYGADCSLRASRRAFFCCMTKRSWSSLLFVWLFSRSTVRHLAHSSGAAATAGTHAGLEVDAEDLADATDTAGSLVATVVDWSSSSNCSAREQRQ